NNKARAWESLGFAHKKKLCQHFDTTSLERFVPDWGSGLCYAISYSDTSICLIRPSSIPLSSYSSVNVSISKI
ncbi:hypothetical protein F2Z43_24515, partial [Bacteroides faecis]